ncbi:phospholipid-translocating ATPase [Kwoniella heveanensis BCC8398]|uniref:P-type phospholipid transporter n=1 Tax=Kwoniella heveanensis BCC8398 TaxID=1296120 RepID=A0A1B9H1S5_9TREE|nr:phospholipid-translocating ATPase [Kwoniella heveanensis BCC8398]
MAAASSSHPFDPYAPSSSTYSLDPSSSTAQLNPHSDAPNHGYAHGQGQPPARSYLNVNDSEEEEDLFDPESIDPSSIDPELRLRTVKTAHSVIAESIRSEAAAENRRAKKRHLFRSMRRKASGITTSSRKKKAASTAASDTEPGSLDSRRDTVTTIGSEFGNANLQQQQQPLPPASTAPSTPEQLPADKATGKKGKGKSPAPRRSVFVNIPLPTSLLNMKGDPIIRYVRNKVRTSKYTIITFLPKNIFEQFRRVANIYFLFLVIIQLFSVFGAPNAQIGMLPLIFILGMTAIKDGIEDWRRAQLDNEVNNSATTKLGGWRNVNQPKDPRSFFEKLFNIGPAPGRPSKGVRNLREREGSDGNQIVMENRKDTDGTEQLEDDVVIVDKESYPLSTMPSAAIPSLSITGPQDDVQGSYRQSLMLKKTSSMPSMISRRSVGVVDWNFPASGSAQWERTLWKKLEVGDLVLLRDNEQVPADIIVLSTSNADNLCFVETKNLDGETNLKIRRGLKATASINSEEDLEHAKFVIDSEPPHANLYTYNGVLRYTPADAYDKGEEKAEGITINELLLRGCSLRNTKWVIGMVVFTGGDTKIMLNGGDTPSKRSKIEKETNFNVIMNFVVLLVLCLITAILHGWYRSLSGTSAEYYEPGAEAAENIYLDSVIIFFSCLIVFQNIVPISLYITVEVVKTVQAYFIFQDVEMYYEPYDTPCVPKTWNISDDLGQIEYVFSDKTGTLTQNVMEFKKCSIQGVPFGEGMTEAMMGAAKRDGQETGPAMEDQEVELDALKKKMLDMMKHTINNRYLREDKLTLVAPDLVSKMANPSDPLRPHIINFFRALAVCHSVLSDTPEPSKPFELEYKAESPDEAALVAAARDVGFPFINKNTNSLDIEVLGNPERWTPLRLLEFNSTRKRMSVIARGPDGRILLFCKGADSVIYGRLDPNHDEALKQATLKDLETFANGGLRTLCIAYREMSEAEFAEWSKKYDAAAAATVDRDGEIEKACELVEHSLTILGATALEDKLQEGVPDAIATLHRAGIKLWILTGDKLQTAIEIGYSCNLLTNDMEVMIISADSEEGARAQIEAGLNKIASVIGPPPTTSGGKIINPGMNTSATFAVVIDGESLRYALQPNLKSLFLNLGTQCSAVICCRVSPSQKALTVRLVKEGCNAMCLSIGDGANDVAMIQEANVGVGLYGLEGSQAAMSADYAFGQFRFLTRLLLVHGRWSYVRVANMHANFFYKNAIFTICMFWYLIFCSFDATYIFEYTLLLGFNLIFTSLPVGVMGIFDQDVNAKAAAAFPQLYKRGIAGLEYTRTRFWLYMFDGLYQSAVIFFIPWAVYGQGETWSSSGRDTNCLHDLGTTIACAGVLAANSYVGINNRYWTVITWVIIGLSTLLVYIWIPIYSSLAVLPYAGEATIIYPTFTFWSTILLTWAIAVGPRWFVSAFKQSYMPKDKDIIREAWISGELKRELGLKRRRDKKKSKGGLNDQDTSSVPQPKKRGSVIDHFQKAYGGFSDDTRGQYEPALTFSPQKDFSRSPMMSDDEGGTGTHTPRSMFSYPPSPAPPHQLISTHNSPTPGPRNIGTVPPPLLLRHSSEPGPYSPMSDSLSPGLEAPSFGNRQLETPVSRLSYTSPSVFDTMSHAEAEINREVRRLSRASTEIKRASLTGGYEISGSNGNAQGSLRGSRGSLASPIKRLSLPLLGVSVSGATNGQRRDSAVSNSGLMAPDLSPIRSSFELEGQDQIQNQNHNHKENHDGSRRGVFTSSSHQSQAHDGQVNFASADGGGDQGVWGGSQRDDQRQVEQEGRYHPRYGYGQSYASPPPPSSSPRHREGGYGYAV